MTKGWLFSASIGKIRRKTHLFWNRRSPVNRNSNGFFSNGISSVSFYRRDKTLLHYMTGWVWRELANERTSERASKRGKGCGIRAEDKFSLRIVVTYKHMFVCVCVCARARARVYLYIRVWGARTYVCTRLYKRSSLRGSSCRWRTVAGIAGGWRFRRGHRGFRHTRIPGKLIQDQSRNNHRTHLQFLSSFSPPFTLIHPLSLPL